MPLPRFERAAPELRDAILDAAAAEFSAHGYDGASLNRILLAAGLSKGAFYYYFDDKADLAATVLERQAGDWIASVGELPPPASAADFWTEMERMQERGLALVTNPQQRELMGRMATAVGRHPEIMERLMPMLQDAQARLGEFFRAGQTVGAVRDDMPVELLLAIIQGMKQSLTATILPADRAPSAAELERFAGMQFDFIRRLSLPAASPEGGSSEPRTRARPRAKIPTRKPRKRKE